MIKIYPVGGADEAALKNEEIQRDNRVEKLVDEIIENVRARGDAALIEYAERFDKVRLNKLELGRDEIERAAASVDPQLLRALERAAENIRAYHEKQKRASFILSETAGAIRGQRVLPLSRVGLYIPGGTAMYPSSVLMNAIPAKIAGVEDLILITPPGKGEGGLPAPVLLAAAAVAGVDRIFLSGGAQAIAALAYGTQTIPAVDKITGPGNIYVATAKRRVYGQVDIDMIAGPSEILIISDEKSAPAQLAADLLSQAEHDENASAVLLTTSEDLARAVQGQLETQLAKLPREKIARASIERNGRILLTRNLEEAVAYANRIAPEHLELAVEDPFSLLPLIKNAGSVFLGRYCPEPVGDYWAGVNHVLPTSGTARFASPLSVDDFVKKSSFVYYSREALAGAKDDIVRLAESEGLTAHARAVSVRFEEENS